MGSLCTCVHKPTDLLQITQFVRDTGKQQQLTMNNILEHVPVHHLKCFTCKTINICSLELQKSKLFHGMVTIVCQKCNSSWKICYLHNCRFGQGRMNEAHQHFNDISHSILHQQRQTMGHRTIPLRLHRHRRQARRRQCETRSAWTRCETRCP